MSPNPPDAVAVCPTFPVFHDYIRGTAANGWSTRFAVHWRFKLDLLRRFNEAWRVAYTTLSTYELYAMLPQELYQDWIARWTNTVFTGYFPHTPDLPSAEVAASVADIGAIAEALEDVRRRSFGTQVHRAWVYEYPDEHCRGRGYFPTIKQAEEERRYFAIKEGRDREPNGWVNYPRYDLEQFLDRATFLLEAGTNEEHRSWLSRLAIWTDPHQPLWGDPPRFETWSRDAFTRSLPVLSRLLRIECPREVYNDATPFWELSLTAQNWWATADRELDPREFRRDRGIRLGEFLAIEDLQANRDETPIAIEPTAPNHLPVAPPPPNGPTLPWGFSWDGQTQEFPGDHRYLFLFATAVWSAFRSLGRLHLNDINTTYERAGRSGLSIGTAKNYAGELSNQLRCWFTTFPARIRRERGTEYLGWVAAPIGVDGLTEPE